MNEINPLLDRLLQGAAQAPSTLPSEPPEAFTTRLLAHWAAREGLDRELAGILKLFRKSLVCAALLMLAAFLATFATVPDGEADELELSTAAFNVSWMP